MVHLPKILVCCLLVFVTAPAAMGQTGQTSAGQASAEQTRVERQITKQGYEVIYSETTWLGRLRILSVRGDILREVVIGPGSGEVMRDVVYEIPGLAVEIAKARVGPNGRKVVDIEGLGDGNAVVVGPQDPLAKGEEYGALVGDSVPGTNMAISPASISPASE
jgi:hypothetical protein